MTRLFISILLTTITLGSIISPYVDPNQSQATASATEATFFPQSLDRVSTTSVPTTTKSAINNIQMMKSLLTQKYQDIMDGKPTGQELASATLNVNQNASNQIKKSMKDYQKQVIDQYNAAQSNYTVINGSNIDNGLNNSIQGTQNIIYEGNSNKINGISNKVNGSSNVIGGYGSRVQGDGNVVMSILSDKSQPAKPELPPVELYLKPGVDNQVNKTSIEEEVKDQIKPTETNFHPQLQSDTQQFMNQTSIESNQAQAPTQVHTDSSSQFPKEHIQDKSTQSAIAAESSHSTTDVVNNNTVKNSWEIQATFYIIFLLFTLLL